jgi:hypothetical protein
MPPWAPEPVWEGAEAIVIGGGHSLRGFPWEKIQGESTIGCNAAYSLGKSTCSVVLFGDTGFFTAHQDRLRAYGGPVFTHARRLQGSDCSWLRTIPRKTEGLHTDALGWNGNTGAGAINLALIFGAKRIFLLGFDMLPNFHGRQNWHDLYDKDRQRRSPKLIERTHPYSRFVQGFDAVERDWKAKFADREIINVSDDTALQCFPVLPVVDFLKGR